MWTVQHPERVLIIFTSCNSVTLNHRQASTTITTTLPRSLSARALIIASLLARSRSPNGGARARPRGNDDNSRCENRFSNVSMDTPEYPTSGPEPHALRPRWIGRTARLCRLPRALPEWKFAHSRKIRTRSRNLVRSFPSNFPLSSLFNLSNNVHARVLHTLFKYVIICISCFTALSIPPH